MTRQHASRYQAPADPYAAHRCANCPHLIYADDQPGMPCRFFAEGCPCMDHKPQEVTSDGADHS